MTLIALCFSCKPFKLPGGLGESEPTHCYGTGDRPGTPDLIGSGTWCPCECRSWPHTPMQLYDVAAKEHPGDLDAIRRRYHDLMVEHGHIVKAKPGQDRNLPCGWPGLPPEPSYNASGPESQSDSTPPPTEGAPDVGN